MSPLCPTELELEEFLADPAASKRRRHIARCRRCLGELGRMLREGELFEKSIGPDTAGAILRALEDL